MTSPSPLDSSHSLLDQLGIEEAEPMVCEDSFENRAILRAAKLMWTQVRDDDGPTGLIRAFTPEELAAERESVWERRRPIMEDPDNMYSEYVSPELYPTDADMPWWVKARLRRWVSQMIEGVPEDKRAQFPVRCEVVRLDGTRCWNWAGNPKKIKRCKSHQGWEQETDLRNAQIARLKLLQSAPAMADSLEELALHASGEAVRLKATTEILDRIGVRGGTEIDMHVESSETDPASDVKARLDKLAARMAAAEKAKAELEAKRESEIVEAEVVEDENPS